MIARPRRVASWAGRRLTAIQLSVMQAATARVRDDGEAMPTTEVDEEMARGRLWECVKALRSVGLLDARCEGSWVGKGRMLVICGVLDEYGDWYEPMTLAHMEPGSVGDALRRSGRGPTVGLDEMALRVGGLAGAAP